MSAGALLLAASLGAGTETACSHDPEEMMDTATRRGLMRLRHFQPERRSLRFPQNRGMWVMPGTVPPASVCIPCGLSTKDAFERHRRGEIDTDGLHAAIVRTFGQETADRAIAELEEQ